MSVLALVAWIVTALAGLYLLAIWLIEYDPDVQRVVPTRLPVPVVFGHVLFAVGGLGSWVAYLITDKRIFGWAAAGALVLVAAQGLTMAVRWLGVYRARPGQASASAVPAPYAVGPHPLAGGASRHARATGRPGSSIGRGGSGELAVPPERHFPVSAVIAHGVFAITTIALVVLTVLGAGGS